MKAGNIIVQIEKAVLLGIVFLVPVIVLPVFPNAFILPKFLILAGGALLLLILKSVKSMVTGSMQMKIGTYDFPLLVLAGAYLASAVLVTPNKAEAFFFPGVATTVVAAVLLYFFVNQLEGRGRELLKNTLFTAAVVVSIVSLLAIGGVLSSLSVPLFATLRTFSLLGGPIETGVFLSTILALLLGKLYGEPDVTKKSLYGIVGVIVTFGLVASVFQSLPDRPSSPQLPPFDASWTTAINTLESSPFLGVGAGNYLTAFNQLRPISFNNLDIWTLRFTTSRSFFLTAMTEAGLVGLSGAVLVGVVAFKRLRKASQERKVSPELAGASLLVALLAVFPGTIPLLVLLAVFLALSSDTHTVSVGTTAGVSAGWAEKLPIFVVTVPAIVGALAIAFFGVQYTRAELLFKRALDAIVANQGQDAYITLQSAINTSPRVDRYHSSYAQVNLALANAIASQENLTDEERDTISILVQQAIREARNTVALNPTRAANWELLASTYRAIIPLAEGADQFAIQSYSQAVALDPLNTNLRIALGGIFYGAGQYRDAIDIFQLAVRTKPDHANAHYNLALAYREDGQTERAISELGIVLSLVEPGSNDHTLVSSILDELRGQQQASENTPNEGTELGVDVPPTDPSLDPPLGLSEEDAPPETPVEESEEEEPAE